MFGGEKASNSSYLPSRPKFNIWVSIFVAVVMFFLLPPAIVKQLGNEGVATLFRYARYIATVICLIFFLRKGRHNAFFLLVILYSLSALVSALLGGGTVFGGIRTMLPPIAAIFLTYALCDQYKQELLWGVFWVCSILVMLNILVLLTIPYETSVLHMAHNVTFLGNRNGFSRYYLSALFASILLDTDRNRFVSVRTIAVLLGSFVQLALDFSSTSFVELLFFVVGFAAIQFKRLRPFMNAVAYAVIYVVVFFLVVVLRAQGLFGFIIQGVFGKSMTFSGRTEIWDQAFLAMDREHLLFGYYYGGPTPLSRPSTGDLYWSAHNAVLDILVWGGLVSLVIAVGFIGIVCWRLFRCRGDRTAAVYSLILGTFFIMGIMEPIMFAYFGFFLGLAAADNLTRISPKLPVRKSLGSSEKLD